MFRSLTLSLALLIPAIAFATPQAILDARKAEREALMAEKRSIVIPVAVRDEQACKTAAANWRTADANAAEIEAEIARVKASKLPDTTKAEIVIKLQEAHSAAVRNLALAEKTATGAGEMLIATNKSIADAKKRIAEIEAELKTMDPYYDANTSITVNRGSRTPQAESFAGLPEEFDACREGLGSGDEPGDKPAAAETETLELSKG